jgi:hypothetical protein
MAQQDALMSAQFPPNEVRHRVRVVVDRGHARLLVERTFYNPGEKPNWVSWQLALPKGGVATALRTLGTLQGQPHWFNGELMETEAAAAAFRGSKATSSLTPSDRAMLSWFGGDSLVLEACLAHARQQKVVAYTLVVPTHYAEGQYLLQLEPMGVPESPASFTFQAAHMGDRLFVDGKPIVPGVPVALESVVAVALTPYRAPRVDGELAVADTGLGRAYLHVQYAIAAQLSEVPARAYVVLGLDNSRSMGENRASAVALARATLERFRDAQVQILDFSRKPKARFAGFVRKSVALASLKRELEGRPISDPGNGSEFELALAEAERLLMSAPEGAARRSLFFSDTLAPERTLPVAITASVGKSGAIVHIVQAYKWGGEITRDDEHPWAEAARLTGGLVWSGGDEYGTSCLKLVRPTSLDHAAFDASAMPGGRSELGDLKEGDGFEHQELFEETVRWARLSGELWSKPFQKTLYPDPAASKRWSALYFGTYAADDEMSQAEQRVLAQRGGAVSPVTSYVVTEPGARAATEDMLDDAFGAGGLGFGSPGEHGGGYGEGIGLGIPKTFDPKAYLASVLGPLWQQCGGKVGDAHVSIETHFVEIADLTLRLSQDEPEQYACLEQAVWSLDLRGRDFLDTRKIWYLEL